MRKRIGRLLSDRRMMGIILLIVQIVLFAIIVTALSDYLVWPSRVMFLLDAVIVIWLVRKYDNPTYKISWIVIVLALPLFGGLFYLLWGNTPFNMARTRHKYEPQRMDYASMMRTPSTEKLAQEQPVHASRARYIDHLAGMPTWANTETKFFSVGEEMFVAMCAEIKNAQKFIFLEYFIIEEGIMWNTILGMLREKAAQGVDVRIMYDDLGCIATLPKNYDQYLETQGIHALRFNRFIPMLNTYLNYRNHRKLCVIDGNVSFMGGINLADEYINEKVRFGHWKDTGIMLRGEGTANVTTLFLQLWSYATRKPMPPMEYYMPTEKLPTDGYVQPFADSPLDDLNVGESVYLQTIHNARDYVYITTPYLVLDNEMITALSIAAQSGVDVRILVPGIPDKKLVYLMTRSYYQQLFRAGVKIYEYTPGFLHAKMLVADDDICLVGTINMDFRSFFLHFECATCFYGGSMIGKVKQDILQTVDKSRLIDEEWLRHVPWIKSIAASLLRLFAPML